MSKNHLKTYREKRNFTKTPEPKGGRSKGGEKPIFVIHKHDASSLHYDVRLEDEGVLISWAVPKGPSDNPHDKRLAIQTEDHPFEYGSFEGIIPEGNYGAGGVMIWDTGTFKNLRKESLHKCLEQGTIEVTFDGKKMHGNYAFVRTHFAPHSWLFFKMKDNLPSHDHLLEEDRSVVSGKTMEEIEGDHHADTWGSPRKTKKAESPLAKLLGLSSSRKQTKTFENKATKTRIKKKDPSEQKKYGRYTVKITHPEKILLPPSITKGDIIEYYEAIANKMVPYMKNRPLMMHRFPEGLSGEAFYQKDASDYFPAWIKTEKIAKTGGYNKYVVCQNQATLVYLANQACITPHLWLSRIDKIDYPDRLIFDLDPSGDDFTPVRKLALSLKTLFDHLKLKTFVMTTGSRGVHVIVPLNRTLEFPAVREFALACAHVLLQAHPELATLEMRKEKRGDKVFIDTLRNQYGATAVAPYAIRAKPGGPIATPLFWDEVADKKIQPQSFNIKNIFKRLDSIDDPWADLLKTKQSLKKAIKTLTARPE